MPICIICETDIHETHRSIVTKSPYNKKYGTSDTMHTECYKIAKKQSRKTHTFIIIDTFIFVFGILLTILFETINNTVFQFNNSKIIALTGLVVLFIGFMGFLITFIVNVSRKSILKKIEGKL